MPVAFLLVSTHICWLTPHHRPALKPSEEDETLAPSVFNGRWLGHEKADVGGSGQTFLQEHHKNGSNKTLIRTSSFKQTPEQHSKAADIFLIHYHPFKNDFRIHHPRGNICILYFSFGCLPFTSFYSKKSHNLTCALHRVMENEDQLTIVQQVRPWHLVL